MRAFTNVEIYFQHWESPIKIQKFVIMKHKQLNYEQRYSIELMLKSKIKKKEIIKALSVDESTFYRELKRNSRQSSYNAKHAQMLADERKKEGHYKTKFSFSMERIIREKIQLYQFNFKTRNKSHLEKSDYE